MTVLGWVGVSSLSFLCLSTCGHANQEINKTAVYHSCFQTPFPSHHQLVGIPGFMLFFLKSIAFSDSSVLYYTIIKPPEAGSHGFASAFMNGLLLLCMQISGTRYPLRPRQRMPFLTDAAVSTGISKNKLVGSSVLDSLLFFLPVQTPQMRATCLRGPSGNIFLAALFHVVTLRYAPFPFFYILLLDLSKA